jgi:hypothetical protein
MPLRTIFQTWAEPGKSHRSSVSNWNFFKHIRLIIPCRCLNQQQWLRANDLGNHSARKTIYNSSFRSEKILDNFCRLMYILIFKAHFTATVINYFLEYTNITFTRFLFIFDLPVLRHLKCWNTKSNFTLGILTLFLVLYNK